MDNYFEVLGWRDWTLINYKTNDVYGRDPFKHPNEVLHCGWY